MQKEYHYIDPQQLVRAPEHTQMFNYQTIEEFEDLQESYAKYDRCHPIYYEKREVEGTLVNAIFDGEKYHQYAISIGMEKVFTCKVTFADNDDRITLMAQLQRTCHDNYTPLFNMIQARWHKHFKGQGHRSDIKEEELDIPTVGADGRRLNIYERIGKELFLTGNKVKQIRKVGMVNKLFFERMELEKFSLAQAYAKCLEEERGFMPEAPTVKAPTYHTTSTSAPVFSEPTSTTEYTATDKTEPTDNNEQQPASEIKAEPIPPALTVIEVTCPHCAEHFKITQKK